MAKINFPDSPSDGDIFGNFIYNDTSGTWDLDVQPRFYKASGGNYEGTRNGYRYHIFTTDGTLTVSNNDINCEFILIGGGGGGGGASGQNGGGGGAGGFINTTTVLTPGSYSVVVGDGGAYPGNNANLAGGNGEDSTFAGYTAKGGGGGGAQDVSNAQSGGSGGGAGENNTSRPGADPWGLMSAFASYNGFGPQGNAGGSSSSGNNTSGGGGGAGTPGHDGASSGDWRVNGVDGDVFYGGNGRGGIGIRFDSFGHPIQQIVGSVIGERIAYTDVDSTTRYVYWIAAGGSGGTEAQSAALAGPLGGGGNGAGSSTAGSDGLANSGSGGGGGANGNVGGNGGSGLCVVRYRVL